MERISRKSTPGRPPELQYTYQIFTLSAIPCTTVWRGSAIRFNGSNPPPFSYQVYITDPSIPVPPSNTPSNKPEFSTRALPHPERGFAVEFLEALVDGSGSCTLIIGAWIFGGLTRKEKKERLGRGRLFSALPRHRGGEEGAAITYRTELAGVD